MVPAITGAGHTCLGDSSRMVGGETVFGFFMDGEEGQQPVIFGVSTRPWVDLRMITQEVVVLIVHQIVLVQKRLKMPSRLPVVEMLRNKKDYSPIFKEN